MNYIEHEKEYCVGVFEKPLNSKEFDDYAVACNYQYSCEIRDGISYSVVKYNSKYYVFMNL